MFLVLFVCGLFSNNVSFNNEAQVQMVEQWCRRHSLIINVDKTKELILNSPVRSLSFSDQSVEVVSSFTYLGISTDDKLSFSQNVGEMYKKANHRLFMTQKLRGFSVSSQILERVYVSLIESVLVFNITVWFGYLTVTNKNELNRIVRNAGKVTAHELRPLEQLCQTAVIERPDPSSGTLNTPC